MRTEEIKMDMELVDKIYKKYKDFLARVTKFEELVAVGARLLAAFQQGLEYLRRPPIDSTTGLIKTIVEANETKRLKSYLEAGCINAYDGADNTSKLHTCHLGLCDHLNKAKSIISELECLLEEVNGAIQDIDGTFSLNWEEDFGAGVNEHANFDNKEEVASSQFRRPEVTDYAVLMGIIYSMVKQDYVMQEKIVSALNFKSSSGELESYSLMWSLRPFVNDEIMHQAWKLIP